MIQADLLFCERCDRTHHKDYIHADTGYEHRCMRCEHEWRTKVAGDIPKACSKCHSAYWDRPRSGKFVTPAKARKRRKAVMRIRNHKAAEFVTKSGMPPPPSVRMGKGV